MSAAYGPECHSYGIRGYGDPSHGVCLIGIAPGADEIKSKRPFTGPSGQLLDSLLKFPSVGWSREKVYVTNAVCWFNNTPSVDEIELCGPRLRGEMSLMRPKLIITCGAIASETILGTKRRKGQRGSVFWSKQWRCYVLDTHHPAYALHSQTGGMSAVQDIIRDLSKIKRVLEWPQDGSIADITYSVVSSLEEAQVVLDNLPRDGRPVTCDIETSNPDLELIDPFRDNLLSIAIAYNSDRNQETCYVFPESIFPPCVRSGRHVAGRRSGLGCPDPACPLGPQDAILTWPDGVSWAWQGGQFDIPGLFYKLGILLPLCEDTMLMSHCTDERPGYHGLKPNAREWLGAGYYEERVKPFYKGKMHLLESQVVSEYNAKDAVYDLRLIPVHTSRMLADDTERLYRNILLPAMQTFIPQQIRGIKIDQTKLQSLAYDEWFPRYITMYRDLQLEAQEIGWPTDDINFNSNPQLATLFFRILSQPITKLTKAGRPSVDKEVLDQMDHPFADKLRAFRSFDGIIDDVFELFATVGPDGCIHPMPYVTNTRTGRAAYQRPGAHQWGKEYTVGADFARLRETIIPHNPETHELIEADYNQVEVWLAQHESQDPVLLQHLQSGDVHSATAEGAFNTKRELHTKEQWQVLRQNAKKIRFGIQYGEGAKGLSRPKPVGLGASVADCQRFLNNFKSTYPSHTAWMRYIQELAKKQGYLRTPTGRVMRFPLVFDHRELRQAINFPIQINASEYCLTSMIELSHPAVNLLAQFNSFIILMAHDALVVESDRRYRTEVIELIKHVMQKPRIPGYPSIRVDIKIGDSLGTVEEYHAN